MRIGLYGCLMSLGMIVGCFKPAAVPTGVTFSTEVPGVDAPAVAGTPAAIGAEDAASHGADSDAKKDSSPKQPPKPLLSAEEVAAGWIQLFDGESLYGWKANSDVNWSVADGVITADKGTKPGLLLTAVPFADYELRCDFWMAKGGNSGLFLRTPFVPTDPGVDCYELNICDTHPQGFNTASFVKRQKPSKEVSGEEAWKTFVVRAEGPHVVVTLDGEEVLDFTDKTDKPLTSGFIGLQMNSGLVKFRNLFVRPLGGKDLFNGKDLSGWREVPGSKSKFEVIDGAIHVSNGQGYLESEATFANFVLQAQVKTNGEALNSGIFFRGLPGKEGAYPGYEFQIQNGIKNGDRFQPADFGTGAIFRRQAARFVVSNDREWTTLTLVAHGPTFATWVNGIPITVWTDERKPHASGNAREGLRLEGGHLSLQGHDPTTNLDFKNIRAVELP